MIMQDPRLSALPTRKGRFFHWRIRLGGLILAAVTVFIYWPVSSFDFLNFDDQVYVVGNIHVKAGLTWESLKWALRTNDASNWHPLTWLSHMLDCQLFGPRAGGHHMTNVILHTANSCLLFVLLLWTTRKTGPSFVVAALFAWHPLHVESVAWVAERKDVLSCFFGLLTMLAYSRYAETAPGNGRARFGVPSLGGSHRGPPESGIPSAVSKRFYLLTVLLFALGLMAKPMLVTLPLVLLLMDYWPLRRAGCGADGQAGRFRRATWARLALEKVPFLLLAAISCVLTLRAQAAGGAIVAAEALSVPLRLASAAFAYYRYVGKILWPTHLAAFYPYSDPPLDWRVWMAALGLAVITATAMLLRKRPHAATGWLWFVGTLVPVIGLVQVGAQAMADRYTYLPSIGLFIAAAYGLGELAAPSRFAKAGLAALTVLVLASCLVATRRQLAYWRNSETLFRHAIAVTWNNYAAYNNLGIALETQDRVAEAAECYKNALVIFPRYADAHCNLATCYRKLKRTRDAIDEYQTALRIDPKNARTHYFLGNELLAEGSIARAIEHYRTGLALKPDHSDLHYQLATALLAQGEIADAYAHYREAIRLKPDFIEALNNLSWFLATQPDARFRDGKEALQLARRAVELTGTNNPGSLDTLAGALAETGRFREAAKTAQTAADLAKTQHAAGLERQIREHLQCYERGQPVRDTNSAAIKPEDQPKP